MGSQSGYLAPAGTSSGGSFGGSSQGNYNDGQGSFGGSDSFGDYDSGSSAADTGYGAPGSGGEGFPGAGSFPPLGQYTRNARELDLPEVETERRGRSRKIIRIMKEHIKRNSLTP